MRERIKKHPFLFWAVYMVFYFTVFSALQTYIRPRVIIECALDQYIPFFKWAIIPYVLWFVWVPLIIIIFFFRSREDFWRLSFVLFTGLTFCLLVYLVLPNGLALRQVVYGDDLLSQIVRNLYRIDPPANVCPSIHVFNSLAVYASVHHSDLFRDKPWIRRANLVLAVMICLSTVLLKQHSCVDVFCGALLCLVLDHISTTYLDKDTPFMFVRGDKSLHGKRRRKAFAKRS